MRPDSTELTRDESALWRLRPAPASDKKDAAERGEGYFVTSGRAQTDGDKLLVPQAASDGHVKLVNDVPQPQSSQRWFIERLDFGALREALATHAEPLALVLFDWSPRAPGELAVVRHDIVVLLEETTDEWWKVRALDDADAIGFVPANHVERLDWLPECPLVWSGPQCRKNQHLVRLRTEEGTFLHYRIEHDNATNERVAHLRVSAIDGPRPEIFEMIYDPPLPVSEAEARDNAADESVDHSMHAHVVREALLAEHHLIDTWTELHPGDPVSKGWLFFKA